MTSDLPDLYSALSATGLIDRLFAIAREEDLGSAGDVTTAACPLDSSEVTASVVALGLVLVVVGRKEAVTGATITTLKEVVTGKKIMSMRKIAKKTKMQLSSRPSQLLRTGRVGAG